LKKLLLYILSSGVFIALAFLLLFISEHISKNRIINSNYEKAKKERMIRFRYYPFYHHNAKKDSSGINVNQNFDTKINSSILFFGGSTTECLALGNKDRLHNLTSEIIREKLSLKYNTYNFGVSGSNTLHSINLLLNFGLTKKPKIAILMHNVNDLYLLLREQTYYTKHPTRSNLYSIENNSIHEIQRRQIKANFNVLEKKFPYLSERFYFLKNRLSRNTLKDINEWENAKKTNYLNPNGIKNQFKSMLKSFIDICKNNNVRPILMTQYSQYSHNEVSNIKADKKIEYFNNVDSSKIYASSLHLEFNEIIRSCALENDVELVDLENLKIINEKISLDGLHYNEIGSKYAAEKIFAVIKPFLN